MKVITILIFALCNFFIFLLSLRKSRSNQFYSDALLLFPLGIYVWGDGLMLAPFWIISSVIFYFLSLQQILNYFLIFLIARSAFEVIYWLNHQAIGKKYNPPLFRNIKWLDAPKSAILYQLLHTCVIVIGIFTLISIT